MAAAAQPDVTEILLAIQAGDDNVAAVNRAFELVYDELRRLAANLMRKERPNHTLQPTALVHEAYCNLVDQTRVEWQNRAHFFGIAARAMRQILVRHARRRASARRGGDWQRVTLDDHLCVVAPSELEVIELHEALSRLAELDERMARIVEMRVFVGMTAEEIAHVLSISRHTVHDDWNLAKMWLARELAEGEAS
jgi:RNA polymerase sigma factor (TIGR02999 family)